MWTFLATSIILHSLKKTIYDFGVLIITWSFYITIPPLQRRENLYMLLLVFVSVFCNYYTNIIIFVSSSLSVICHTTGSFVLQERRVFFFLLWPTKQHIFFSFFLFYFPAVKNRNRRLYSEEMTTAQPFFECLQNPFGLGVDKNQKMHLHDCCFPKWWQSHGI